MASSKQLTTRPLGKNGPQVPRLGLGMMGDAGMYGLAAPDTERLAFLDKVFKMGETFWDTADLYNDSEVMIGKWFAANPTKRSSIFLATKFAYRENFKVDSSPEYCREAVEKSLARLQTSYIDLYYAHRLDTITPVEKTMAALVELQKAGKIRHIGLSEVSAASLRRACAVAPVAAIQMEYSPFALEIEKSQRGLLDAARELGVAVVAYSPLGRGILTGAFRSQADLSKPGDLRSVYKMPWFEENNLEHNLALVDEIVKIAKAKDCSPAQLVLGWILAQGDDFFAIPGSTKVHRVAENLQSLNVVVTAEEDKAIRKIAEAVIGGRLPQAFEGDPSFFADTPPLDA